jgi:transcription antitermination protein NusB
MLNRRFLRIKVMQALYSYFQSEGSDIKKAEKDLITTLDNIYSLYLWLLALLRDVHQHSILVIEDAKNKKLPSREDLNPNTKFQDNRFLKALEESKFLKDGVAKRKISWNNDADIVRKIFNDIRATEDYKKYMSTREGSLNDDKDFLMQILVTVIAEHELLTHFFEEKNVHWADDLFVAIIGVKKTIESFDGTKLYLQGLYKNEAEDLDFARKLFEKCIMFNNDFEKLIAEKTVNWEVERIAQMDVLLMKMALAEILFFENIPVKVSLNEYIDISKEYSTPKSKVFINGILDKIVLDLKSQQKIVKSGRGLQEN